MQCLPTANEDEVEKVWLQTLEAGQNMSLSKKLNKTAAASKAEWGFKNNIIFYISRMLIWIKTQKKLSEDKKVKK